jgi:hypothetical protein
MRTIKRGEGIRTVILKPGGEVMVRKRGHPLKGPLSMNKLPRSKKKTHFFLARTRNMGIWDALNILT